jgi:hypothetical protein
MRSIAAWILVAMADWLLQVRETKSKPTENLKFADPVLNG